MKKKIKIELTNKISKSIKLMLAFVVAFATIQFMELPQEVEAATNKSGMMLWNDTTRGYLNPPAYSSNQAWQGSKLYWGHKEGNQSDPMLWDILNSNESSFGGSGNLLLFYTGDFGVSQFREYNSEGNAYPGSKLDTLLTEKMNSSLSAIEKSSTIDSGRSNDEYILQDASKSYKDDFSGKKWFAPTAKMMSTTAYGFSKSVALNTARAYADYYWLSSAYPTNSNYAGFIYSDGRLNITTLIVSNFARVASNVSSNDILFVSNADGVKGKALAAVNANASGTYKLTLKDSSQTNPTITVTSREGDKLSFDYANVTTGNNQKLSAIITDALGENIVQYGVVVDASTSGSGSASITLPSDFNANGYKLKFFSEQCNGDKKTDLASELVDVPVIMHNVVVNYLKEDGTSLSKTISVGDGSNATTKVEDFLKTIPTSGARGTQKWRFTNKTGEIQYIVTSGSLSSVTENVTVTVNYINQYDVSVKYKQNNTGFTDDTTTIVVDQGGEVPLPTLPTYSEQSGVTYRYKDSVNKWELESTTATISGSKVTNVQGNTNVNAPVIKQLKTTIKYRNESKPEEYISNNYWIDEGASVEGNIPNTSTPYLPTLQKQIKGYRLKEQTSTNKSDIWKSSDAANALRNITKPSTIQPDYVKNWEVVFHTWDDNLLKDVVYIDDQTALSASQIPTPPYRPFYNFAQWSENLTNVTKDLIVKPVYSRQNFEIRTTRDLDVLDSNTAKTMFGSLTDDKVNEEIKKLFEPQLYSGGIPYNDQTGLTMKVKNTGDIAKVKAGVVGSYQVIGEYTNPTDTSFTAVQEVTLRITDSMQQETTKKGKLAANDFVLSVEETTALNTMFYSTLAGAIAFDTTGVKLVSVKDASALKSTPGIYPVVFKATLDGKEVTTTVNVQVKDNANGEEISTTLRERISANDITLKSSEVTTIKTDTTKLIALAQAKAVNVNTGEQITNLTVSNHNNIGTTKGRYSISFMTANSTAIQIDVYVSDAADEATQDDGYRISANGFTISIEEAKTAQDSDFIALANVKAIKKSDGSYGTITVDKASFKEEKGTYDITYSAPDSTAITVSATVVDNSQERNKVRISANDFSLAPSEAGTPNETKLKQASNVKAVDTETGAEITAITVDGSKLKGEKGSYPVTFSANGATVTVLANVADSVKEENGMHIEGSDFTISKDEVASINDSAKVVQLSAAKAYVIDTSASLTVTASGMDAIQAEAGTYPITLSASDGSNTITLIVNAIISDEATENPTVLERITANHFTISKSEVASLSNDDLIARANAKAMSTDTGKDISVSVKSKTIKAEKGIYDVTFGTDKNTNVTVKVSVVDNAVVNNQTIISGNNFAISIDEMDDATLDQTLIQLGNVTAKTTTGNKVGVIVSNKLALEKKAGIYSVTYQSENTDQAKLTLQVEVQENGISNSTTKEILTANDIQVSKEAVKDLDNKDTLIQLAGAKAVNSETGANVKVVAANHNAEAKKGIYKATFSTANGTELDVKVVVQDKGTIDTGNKESISANSFKITKSELESAQKDGTLDDVLKQKASVRAVDLTTGLLLDTSVTQSIEAKKGEYEVTFKTAKNTSIMVLANVVDNSTQNPDTNIKEAIYANDFSLSLEQANAITADKLIAWANAYAENTETGEKINVSVKGHDIISALGKYSVTFKTDKGTEVSVVASVKKAGVLDPSGDEYIHANDIYLSVAEVATLNDDLLITRANAVARNNLGYELSISKVEHSISNSRGTYDVTFKAGGVGVSVKAHVRDVVTESVSGNAILSANHFYMNVQEAVAKEDAVLMALANAKAVDKETGAPIEVFVDNKDRLEAKKGVYDISFKANGQETATVKATVMDSGTIDSTNNEGIYANSFSVKSSEVAGLTEQTVTKLAAAKAYNTKDGSDVAITSVKFDGIKPIKGNYEVSFATDKGTSTQVQVVVQQNAVINETDQEELYANNFTLSESQVEVLLKDSNKNNALITYAQAKAFVLNTTTSIPVTVKSDTLVAKQGQYEVVFTTGNTDITSKVTVTSDGTVDTNKKESISANDFSIEVAKVQGLTDSEIIKLAKAEAMSTDTGDTLKINVDYSNLEKKKGVYDVIFTTDNGTSVTVKGTVVENGSEDNEKPSGEQQDSIYGNNFSLSVEEAKTVNADTLLKLGNVKAYDKISGAPVNVEVDDVTVVNGKGQGNYVVGYTSEHGSTLSLNVTITKENGTNTDTSVKERITANDFSISIEEAELITTEDIIALAKAKAVNSETGADLEVTVLSDIKDKKGIYDVTFATVKGTSVTVKATVVDNGSSGNVDPAIEHSMYANDFSLSIEEAKTVTAETLLKLANAKAYEKVSGAPVIVNVDEKQVLGKPQGRYAVEFTTNKASITVYATITQSGNSEEVENPDDPNGSKYHERITANDFSVEVDKVANIKDAEIIKLANAKAIIEETGEDIEIKVISKLEAKKGICEVTFATVAGTSVTVKATVVDNGSSGNVDPAIEHSMYANDFSLSVDEAKTVDAKTLLTLANAKAYEKASGAPVTINVDEAQVQGKPQGRYAVEFTTDKASITVYATVTKDGGSGEVTNPDDPSGPKYHERITANDFSVEVDKVTNIKDAEIIKLANAKAIIEETGEDIEIKVTSKLEAKKGIYDVTFATAAGTSVTVKATVKSAGSSNPDDKIKETIYANDFAMSVEEAINPTSDTLIKKAKAQAYDTLSGAPLTVLVNENDIKGKPQGTYALTFSTEKGTSITVHVTLTTEGITNPDATVKEEIYANDFSLKTIDVNGLKDADLIRMAKAKAYHTETGADVAITNVVSNIKAEQGVYEVTFKTEKGTGITVKATVTNGGQSNPDESIKEEIYANNFYLSILQAENLTDNDLIAMAKAKATNTDTGENVVVKVVKHDIKAISGAYQVRFATEKGTTIDVQATVTSNGIDNPDSSIKEVIYANDFSIGKEDAKNVSEETILKLSKATAYNYETGAKVEVKVKSNTIKGKSSGVYDVILMTAHNTTITIKATIEDKGIIDDRNGEVITGNDFSVQEAEVESLTNEKIIEKAKAKLIDLSTGGELKLHVKGRVLAKVGTYEVILYSDRGTELNINVTVTPSPTIPEKPVNPGGNTGGNNGSNSGNTGGNSGSNEKPKEDENTFDKPVIKEDGSIEKGEITVKPSPDGKKPTLNPDGTITVPKGGSVEVNGKEFIFKDGATLNRDGTILVKAGSIVRINGKDVTFTYGGKINADGTYVMFDKPSGKDKEKESNDISLKDSILPLWILGYIGGYFVLTRRKKEEEA